MTLVKLTDMQKAILRELMVLKGEAYKPLPRQTNTFISFKKNKFVTGTYETGYTITQKGIICIQNIDNPPPKKCHPSLECIFCFKQNVHKAVCPDCGRNQNKSGFYGGFNPLFGDDLDAVEKRDLGWNYS